MESPPRSAIASYGVSLDIVDIKPVNMEELTEVITSSEFHPIHCNLFMYSSSKSNIKLADMRDAALCDRHAKSGSSVRRKNYTDVKRSIATHSI